jgi:aerobic carbon-monoxide dehydrogenase medium subunit
MKPVPFEYDAPETVEAALALLAEHGDDGKVLAGGQSLVPMMNFRLARPSHLIDINRLPGLSGIERNGNLSLGALVRQAQVEASPIVADAAPLLVIATRWIGHPPIRARGTVGGSLVHNDPAGEYPAALLALDATATAASVRGERAMTVDALLADWLSTTLEPDELVTSVTIPGDALTGDVGMAELARRHGDFALAGSVVRLVPGADGTIEDVRIVAFGGLPRATRMTHAEDALKGTRPGDAAFEEAGRRASAAADPVSDIHASAEYRRHLIGVMTVRALRSATERRPA